MKVQTEYVVAQFNISKKEVISNERLNARLDNFATDFNDCYKEKYSMEAFLSIDFAKKNSTLLMLIENEYPADKIFDIFDEVICQEKYADLRNRLSCCFEHKCNC